jgi:hypothetical protein
LSGQAGVEREKFMKRRIFPSVEEAGDEQEG